MIDPTPIRPSVELSPSLRASLAGIYREAARSYHAIEQPEKARRLEVQAAVLEAEGERGLAELLLEAP